MDQHRRLLLNAGALALFAAPTSGSAAPSASALGKPPPGKPGEFDFLAGSWKILNRRKKPSGEPDLFEGEATCWTILGGVGSVEELRIPARKFSGMGLRLLDVENKVWIDHWVNARSGVMTLPGTKGGFTDGAGVFTAEDTDGDKPILIQGIWDRITPTSCRWRQLFSHDGGRTWDEDWSMDWTRN